MYFIMHVFLRILIWQLYGTIPSVSANGDTHNNLCPFVDTVNLTNHQMDANGSYLYQDILIPPEKQKIYDYDLKFLKARETVEPHLRGCVCDKRPCMKLCCNETEYFNDHENIKKCVKLKPEMAVAWDLTIQTNSNQTQVINIFKHFTTQVGLPCQQPMALDIHADKWVMEEDGILFITSDHSKLNTLNYCYSPRLNNNSIVYSLHPFSCPIENIDNWKLFLNTYAMAVSVLFLIPTIVVYLMLKSLRGNLRGKLLICYLLSMTVWYTIISFINISDARFNFIECSLLGYTCYFFLMATFLWLSVLCCDILQNLKETNLELMSQNRHKQFIFYSLYTWLTAGLATIILICIQLSDRVDDIYKPDIGLKMCWLNTEKWSAMLYFYGPNLIILIFNVITFSHITHKIYIVRRDLARITNKEKFMRENVIVILRLFIVMGVSWLFEIIAYCLREYKNWDFLFVISDFINATQGIIIFSLFVLKPDVWKQLKESFHKKKITQTQRSILSSTSTILKLHSSTSENTAVTSSIMK